MDERETVTEIDREGEREGERGNVSHLGDRGNDNFRVHLDLKGEFVGHYADRIVLFCRLGGLLGGRIYGVVHEELAGRLADQSQRFIVFVVDGDLELSRQIPKRFAFHTSQELRSIFDNTIRNAARTGLRMEEVLVPVGAAALEPSLSRKNEDS